MNGSARADGVCVCVWGGGFLTRTNEKLSALQCVAVCCGVFRCGAV